MDSELQNWLMTLLKDEFNQCWADGEDKACTVLRVKRVMDRNLPYDWHSVACQWERTVEHRPAGLHPFKQETTRNVWSLVYRANNPEKGTVMTACVTYSGKIWWEA